MESVYVLRVAGRKDEYISDDAASALSNELMKRTSTIRITLKGELIGVFPKKDVKVEKRILSVSNDQARAVASQRYGEQKRRAQAWYQQELEKMSDEKKNKIVDLVLFICPGLDMQNQKFIQNLSRVYYSAIMRCPFVDYDMQFWKNHKWKPISTYSEQELVLKYGEEQAESIKTGAEFTYSPEEYDVSVIRNMK